MTTDRLIVIHFDDGGYLHKEYHTKGTKVTTEIGEALRFQTEEHALRTIEDLDQQGALFPEHDPRLDIVTVDVVKVELVKRIIP